MNWGDRIKKAEKSKYFSDEDKLLAGLWVTCPFSEYADKIELRTGKIEQGPRDIYLLLDGLYFTKGVEEDDVDLVVNCYNSMHKQVEALVNGTDRISGMKRFLGE